MTNVRLTEAKDARNRENCIGQVSEIKWRL